MSALREPLYTWLQMKLICAIALCATLCLAAPKIEPQTEISEINGAKFRVTFFPRKVERRPGDVLPRIQPGGRNFFNEGKLPAVLAVFHRPRVRGGAIRLCRRRLGHPGSDTKTHRGAAPILHQQVRAAQRNLHHRTFHGRVPHHDVHGDATLPVYDAGLALCGPAGAHNIFHGARRVRCARCIRLLLPGRVAATGQSSGRLQEHA